MPEPDDVNLLGRVRAGDTQAYGLLFARHREAALAQAGRVSRSVADADDLVAEASTKVLGALLRGGGPRDAFRAYFLQTIRHLAYDRSDRERREAPAPVSTSRPAVDLTDPVLREFERSTALAAFQTLPQRWQFVLWHLEVEGLEVADVAVLLDLTASATASLAYRAREGLRQAYLTCHALSTPPQGHSCRLTSDRLASYIRGGLSSDRQDQVGAHLAWCRSCCAAYRELTDINTTLRAVAGAAATTAPSRSVGGITSAAV